MLPQPSVLASVRLGRADLPLGARAAVEGELWRLVALLGHVDAIGAALLHTRRRDRGTTRPRGIELLEPRRPARAQHATRKRDDRTRSLAAGDAAPSAG